MKFNFNVNATTFATISLVIAAAGFFIDNAGIGWGFGLVAVGAFVFGRLY